MLNVWLGAQSKREESKMSSELKIISITKYNYMNGV